jgi:protein-S-isoprenylcysteine O-methyltransferase Ste14
MLVVSIIICHYVLILPEEQYLARKFGDEYEEYIASVRRWLGRK